MSSKKVWALYDIDIYRLPNGEHLYEMPLNDEFFSLFDFGLLEKGTGTANIQLVKTETMITVTAGVTGAVELTCDRSLEQYPHPVSLQEVLYIKYGDEEMPLEDDLLMITHNTQKINLAQFLYEIIGASLPMKKIHPDYRREDDDDEDDISEGTVVYSSSIDNEAEAESGTENEDDTVDPRWQILKNLRDN
ncbi:hypothetical protein D770_05820 [Flammeovirgaceae bacterium 311]|nr:hypothetical protein D770_05820 [Flammeovirgaceae bacterium 311]